MVECKLCGKTFKQLTSHLNRIHGIYCDEYRQQFPESKITSDDLIENLKYRMMNGQAKTMGDKAKGCKKPEFSKFMIGNKRGIGTDRSNEKQRYKDQALKQHAEANFGEWTEERRLRQAEITKRRWQDGCLKHVWKPKWHIELAEYLKSKNIEFVEEFILPEDKAINGYRLSKPFDFYIPTLNMLIELNGCFWHGCSLCYDHHPIQDRVIKNDEEKQKVAFMSGYQLLKIWEHDKGSLFKIIDETLD